MTNPSLQQEQQAELYELINNFKSEFDPYFYEEDWDSLLAFIHKVIAERDEALRKDFYKIDRYYTNPKGKVMVYVDDMSSLLSKE